MEKYYQIPKSLLDDGAFSFPGDGDLPLCHCDYQWRRLYSCNRESPGEFSEGGQKLGYGIEYRLRDAGEDPMETKGDHFELLYSNDYDEFSPISSKLKEELLNLPEVDKENSYVMEGAYLLSTISRKAVSPMDDHYSENQKEKEGTG